ncbi:MAG: glutaminase [Synechococcaceae cyanobacterium]|nr:glutaminase [Synechococcaceae cyanobacterium]
MDSGHRMQALFALVSEAGVSDAERIRMGILASGLRADDPRLRSTMTALDLQGTQPIDLARFIEIVGEELLLVSKAIQGRLVIPEWQEFQHDIAALHQLVAGDHHGRNADYIPILRDADPERWGVSVCSVDGQRLDLGDVDCHHSIQSVSKPLSYAYALDRLGEASTAEHIGDEPSGRPFNSLDLLPDGRPFNACVNAGAILVAGLIAAAHPERSSRQVTQELMDLWSELCGAAFHVACADGQVEPQERQRLEAIAQSLEIHPGVLDLEIARFQRRRG